MADETKDASKQEQLSIVVRYADREGTVKERFLTFVHAASLNAESLSAYFIQALEENEIDPSGMVSQGYDGASVMSGRCTGVQKRIKDKYPCALYIHCCAHILNLVLVDCSKKISLHMTFFAFLSLCMFLCQHQKHIQPL